MGRRAGGRRAPRGLSPLPSHARSRVSASARGRRPASGQAPTQRCAPARPRGAALRSRPRRDRRLPGLRRGPLPARRGVHAVDARGGRRARVPLARPARARGHARMAHPARLSPRRRGLSARPGPGRQLPRAGHPRPPLGDGPEHGRRRGIRGGRRRASGRAVRGPARAREGAVARRRGGGGRRRPPDDPRHRAAGPGDRPPRSGPRSRRRAGAGSRQTSPMRTAATACS